MADGPRCAGRRGPDVKTICGFLLLYAVLVPLGYHSLFWAPEPVVRTAHPTKFSELRSRQHIQALSEDLEDRQVGTKGVALAADYLLAEARAVQALSKSSRLTVEVIAESYTGSVFTNIVGKDFYNAYQNITAVGLRLFEPGTEGIPGVLVGAHFDSTIGTPGASDCASCTAVALEVARALVMDPEARLPAPAVFLLNGGEETFSQGADGFMQQGAWRSPLGAFLNLESTGSGGPAVAFQVTGSWTAAAYARAAPYPRGTVVAQDCFAVGIIPADSDYHMFSAQQLGNMPGIDVASLLDAATYHTKHDNLARIRRGSLQAWGENVKAAVQEFGRELAEKHHSGNTAVAADTPVYFDILGRYLVVYDSKMAKLLHNLPSGLLLGGLGLLGGMHGWPALAASIQSLAGHAAWAVLQWVLTLLLPAAAGAVRVATLGNSIGWFGHDVWAYLAFVPFALLGLLLPYPRTGTWDVQAYARGSAVACAAFAGLLTALGAGSAFCFLLSFAVGAPAAFLLSKRTAEGRWGHRLTALLIVPHLLAVLPNGIALSLVMVQRASMGGAAPAPFTPYASDLVSGGVMGLTVLAVAGGAAPWFAHACRPYLGRVQAFLALFGLAASLWVSLALSPYSSAAAKHIYLQHLVSHGASETASTYHLSTTDAVTPALALQGLPDASWRPSQPQAWQVLHPAEALLQSVQLQTPSLPRHAMRGRPEIARMKAAPLIIGPKGSRRVELELRVPAPGAFGAMNISGPVSDWSYPPEAFKGDQAGRLWRAVRFAGNNASVWPMWFELKGPDKLRIEVSAGYIAEHVAHMHPIAAKLPFWTSVKPILTFQSVWEF